MLLMQKYLQEKMQGSGPSARAPTGPIVNHALRSWPLRAQSLVQGTGDTPGGKLLYPPRGWHLATPRNSQATRTRAADSQQPTAVSAWHARQGALRALPFDARSPFSITIFREPALFLQKSAPGSPGLLGGVHKAAAQLYKASPAHSSCPCCRHLPGAN